VITGVHDIASMLKKDGFVDFVAGPALCIIRACHSRVVGSPSRTGFSVFVIQFSQLLASDIGDYPFRILDAYLSNLVGSCSCPASRILVKVMTNQKKVSAPRRRRSMGADGDSGSGPVVARMQRPRLVDAITEQLRDLILSGDMAPGTQLLQVDLSQRLGVSRTPLREALRVLERDGLIQTANGNRTVVVVDPDPNDLLELYEVREALDGLAASLCAQHGITPAQKKKLDSLSVRMESLSMPADANEYIKNHADFHRLLADASANRRVQDLSPVYINMSSQKSLVRFVRAHEPERAEELESIMQDMVSKDDADHRELLAAIADGQARQAETIARRHITRSIGLVRKFLPDS
jgi:DNA-binding GntR family transcriptional regulator